MADYDIWVLGESQVTISGGGQLDGVTQGDGSHLVGRTITLNTRNWSAVAVTDNDSNFQDSDTSQRLDGAQTIDGVSYSSGTIVEAEFSFTVSDGTNSYTLIAFNIRNSSPAYGTVEGVAFLGDPGDWPPIGTPLLVIGAQEGPNIAATDYVEPICFTAGTLIETPDGPRSVEHLQPGDHVVTISGQSAQLRWTGRRAFRPAQGDGPIHFRKGAIGNLRDLVVSPHHRIYLEDWRAEMLFGTSGVLVAAKNFVNGQDITRLDCDIVTYVHLMCDRHEIIIAEGVPSESLYPGPCALKSLSAASRREVLSVFPGLAGGAGAYGPLAASELKSFEAQVLLAA